MPIKLTHYLVKRLNLKAFPSYLLNYYKYPVILDGQYFQNTFDFTPKRSMQEIFEFYREQKEAILPNVRVY